MTEITNEMTGDQKKKEEKTREKNILTCQGFKQQLLDFLLEFYDIFFAEP